jgi:hypothetical protein
VDSFPTRISLEKPIGAVQCPLIQRAKTLQGKPTHPISSAPPPLTPFCIKSLARCRPHSPHSAAFPCLHPRFDDLRLGRRGSGVGRCTGGGRLLLVRGVKRRSWPVLGTRRRHHGEGFTVLEFSSVSPSSLILRVSVFSCGSAHARIIPSRSDSEQVQERA